MKPTETSIQYVNQKLCVQTEPYSSEKYKNVDKSGNFGILFSFLCTFLHIFGKVGSLLTTPFEYTQVSFVVHVKLSSQVQIL